MSGEAATTSSLRVDGLWKVLGRGAERQGVPHLRVPQKIACDYPRLKLDKVVSKRFVDENSPAYQLVKRFRGTNEDQNQVARWIAVDGMSREQAAKKWLDANREKWRRWMPPKS